MSQAMDKSIPSENHIRLFLCGDVMTGRGIDQILPHPGNPQLYERYVRDARSYLKIAEENNGPIPFPVSFSYIWGDALKILDAMKPDIRIINLETSVTTSENYWTGKGINYRMHPMNIPCLSAAEIDCCVLANNHVLDWGYTGLNDTLTALHHIDIKTAGAGSNLEQAARPALLNISGKGRVWIFSYALPSSGVPWDWQASDKKPGINLLTDLSGKTIDHIAQTIRKYKQTGDLAIVSIHWGGNWGYHVPDRHIYFAHQLIDSAAVDMIHGHSSHHPMGIEIYRNKPIIYGCGDFLNDYEGISGHEAYRGDLALMYFVTINPASGKLAGFEMVPTQIRKFRSNRASKSDTGWLKEMFNRENKKFENLVIINKNNNLSLHW